MSGIKGRSGKKNLTDQKISRTHRFIKEKYKTYQQYARERAYKTKEPYTLIEFIQEACDRYIYMDRNNLL